MRQYYVKVIDRCGLTTRFGPYAELRANQGAAEFRRYGLEATLEKVR